jgi:hypothetical protein
MFKHKRATLFFLPALVVAVAATMTVLYARDENERAGDRAAREQGRQDVRGKLPITDYDAPEPSGGGEQRARRRAKSRTYNEFGGLRGRRNPLLNAEVGVKHTEWEWGLTSALPVEQSSAVIVGEVVDASAYLSEDKTNVYSEFTMRVGEVIKNDGAGPIAPGDLIAADRPGGRVRTPSGRVASFTVAGQGVPEVGKRYVFFLGFNRREAARRGLTDLREMSRHLLTGYELRDGEVFPLDFAGGKNFQDHRGKGETVFLNEIRASAAGSSPATSDE